MAFTGTKVSEKMAHVLITYRINYGLTLCKTPPSDTKKLLSLVLYSGLLVMKFVNFEEIQDSYCIETQRRHSMVFLHDVNQMKSAEDIILQTIVADKTL